MSRRAPPPAPRPFPPWGEPGLLRRVLGPLAFAALAATAAGAALGSCLPTIELLEAPGEPAVVVSVERRHVDKRWQAFAEVRADDGTRWTAKGEADDVGSLRPGQRTTMHRAGGERLGARHPEAIVAVQRDERRQHETIGFFVLLCAVTPLFALLLAWRVRRDRQVHRLWTHGEVAEGNVLEVAQGKVTHVRYAFRTAAGESLVGSLRASDTRLRLLGAVPEPGTTVWVLYAAGSPERHVVYALAPRVAAPTP